ncbi:MAG: hypothetical protein WD995_01435 [Gemmatimonadota bacterium]
MILAFAVIGGFLYWLNGQASEEIAMRQAYADSVAAAEEAEANRAPVIQADRIQMDASPYEGDEIRLEEVPVASTIGSQGYWLEMPNGNPFLVSVSPAVEVEGGDIEPGDMVSLTGRVMAVNDSVLTSWTDAGTIGDGDRLAAEFATHFIEVLELSVTPGGSDEGPEGGQGSEG